MGSCKVQGTRYMEATCWGFICLQKKLQHISHCLGSTLHTTVILPHFLLSHQTSKNPYSTVVCTPPSCVTSRPCSYLSKPCFQAHCQTNTALTGLPGFPLGVRGHFHLNWKRQSLFKQLTKKWCCFWTLPPSVRFPISCPSWWSQGCTEWDSCCWATTNCSQHT